MALTYENLRQEASRYVDGLGELNLLSKGSAALYVSEIKLLHHPLVGKINQHLEGLNTPPAHGFAHLEYVASNAPFIANMAVDSHNVPELGEEIIQRTIRLGLLHDIERWRGYDRSHCTEGAKVADKILAELNIIDPYLHELIEIHDDAKFNPTGNPQFDIPAAAVFDVDHFLWFTGMRDTYWLEQEKKGIDPRESLTRTDFLDKYVDSFRSEYGRMKANQVTGYGLGIIQHLKEWFL